MTSSLFYFLKRLNAQEIEMGKSNCGHAVVDLAEARQSAEGQPRFRKQPALLKGEAQGAEAETVWNPESMLSGYNVNDPHRFIDLQGKYAFGNKETGWALFERTAGLKSQDEKGDVVKFVGTVKGDKEHPLAWFPVQEGRRPIVSITSIFYLSVGTYKTTLNNRFGEFIVDMHAYLRTVVEPLLEEKYSNDKANRRQDLLAAAQAVAPKVQVEHQVQQAVSQQEVSKDLSLLFSKKRSGKFELPCGSVIGSWVHNNNGLFTHWVQVHSVTAGSPLANLKKVGFGRGWEAGISFRMHLVFSVPVLEQKKGITYDLFHDSLLIHGYLRSLGLEGGWILTPEQLAEKRAAKEKQVQDQSSTKPAQVGEVEEVVLGAEAAA